MVRSYHSAPGDALAERPNGTGEHRLRKAWLTHSSARSSGAMNGAGIDVAATHIGGVPELAVRLGAQRTIAGACGDALRFGMARSGAVCGEVLFRTASTRQLACLAHQGPYPWCAEQSGGRRLGSKLAEVPLQDQKPLCITDVANDERLDFELLEGAELARAMSIPLVVRGRTLGAMNLCGGAGARLGPEAAGELTVAAALLAPVIENLYVQEQATSKETERRQFLVRELEASEDERRRIARELHDGVGQTLTGLTMTIDGAAARLSSEGASGEAKEMLQVSREAAVSALQDIRRVILALRPPALDDMGLFAALEAYGRRILREAGVDLTVKAIGTASGIAPVVENVVFRVAQEAINNVARHSGARSCRLTLTATDTTVRACVRDDGAGFDLGSQGDGHVGLESMRERVDLVRGRLAIHSEPGKGTRVDVRVPRRA
jgi:signal transduction histidine kinase